MNNSIRQWLVYGAVACLCVVAGAARAQNTERTAPTPPPAAEAADPNSPAAAQAPAADTEAADAADDTNDESSWDSKHRRRSNGDDLVSIGGDSKLEKGKRADSVVSVFGSSTSEGDVSDSVVSVVGDTRVSGTVGDTAVAVLGDNFVDGKVSGSVVAVLGSVWLGPEADVHGDVVVVGGTLHRDPGAVIHGGVENVLGVRLGSFHWLRPWVQHCLLYIRPLAIAPGLGWAWTLALSVLALYALVALMFRNTIDQGVVTLEAQPGKAIVAALIATLLSPVVFALLCITIIGVAFVPFAVFGMFLAVAFGKIVVLAWIGRRCTKSIGEGAPLHTALAVLLGGAIVLALYLVPVVGFIVYKLIGILGFGVVVLMLIQALRTRRGESNSTPPLVEPAFAAASASAPAGERMYASTAGAPDSTTTGPTTGEATMSSTTDGTTTANDAAGAASASGTASAGGAAGAAGTAGAGGAAGAAGTASAGGAAGTASGAGGVGGAGGNATGANGLSAAAYPRAGFLVRMAALIIDTALIAALLGMLNHSSHGEHQLMLLVLAAYGAIMWKVKGTTIGGIVFGLQVVRVDGRPVDWATAIVRALSCFLSLAAVGLGFLWIAFDEGRQGWHDKIAGTAVVRMPKGVSLL